MTERLSIALASRDGERFIGEQLNSFLSQTRLPDELVVGDDASTDRTREIVRAFAKRAPFEVRLLENEKALGCAGNIWRAIRECRGDIVFPSDHDDIWLPRKLARMAEAFAACPEAALVIADSELAAEDGRPLGRTLFQAAGKRPLPRRSAPGEGLMALLERRPPLYGHGMAFKASAWREVPPFPLSGVVNNHHDTWIAYWIAAFHDIVVIDEPLTLYRTHPRQVGLFNSAGLGVRLLRAFAPLPEAHRADYALRVEVLRFLRERLRRRGYAASRVMAALEQAESFQRVRCEMPLLNRNRRLGSVLRKSVDGSYDRFAFGVLSAVQDVLRGRLPR